MKAVIAMCLTEMIEKNFGKDKLALILENAGIPKSERAFLPTSDISDNKIMDIYKLTCSILDISAKQLGDMFGEYWCKHYITNLYEAYYKSALNAKDFLLKMKRIHNSVTRRIPDATPPDFEYIDEAPDKLIMKYVSNRNLQVVWFGCIKGVGLLFNEKLDIRSIDDNTVEITFMK